MRRTRTISRLAALAAGATMTVVLTACGGGSAATDAAAPATPPTPAAGHNDADIRFAQMMIPHHQQALEMAEMAADRAERQEVEDLAEQIRSAQGPEIATMTAFLQAWGAQMPTDAGDMAGMDHSSTGGMSDTESGRMAGMMTPEQMVQLEAASGAAFDTMFVQMMIAHHESAVAEARTELAEGSDPQAKDLAQKIVDGQMAEINQLQKLLQI